MFGKLLKYELKSTYRTFVVIFMACILASFIPATALYWKSNFLTVVGSFLATVAVIPVIIIFISTIIQRYNRNLYGDEGYLMFTLPVKSWQIILAKFTASSIWALCAAIVSCISLGIIFFTILLQDMTFAAIIRNIQQVLMMAPEAVTLYIWIFITVFVAGLEMIMLIYLSISLSNLPIIKNYNNVVAVVLFFAISWFESKIGSFLFKNFYPQEDFILTANSMDWSPLLHYMWAACAFAAVMITVYFFITSYITSKKLYIR